MVRNAFMLVLVLATVIGVIPVVSDAQQLTPAERTRLEAEYAQLQKEIAEQQQILDATRAQKNTLQGDVTQLNAQIRKAQAQIDQKNLAIRKISTEIQAKNQVIGTLTSRIERGRESLAAIMRERSELDNYSLIEIALSAESLSSMLRDADTFSQVESEMHTLFTDIRTAKAETEEEKMALANKQSEEVDARYVVETKKKAVAVDEAEKRRLLAITKNQEAEYQKVLAERQAKAAAINAALFPLRDAGAIKFEDALAFARKAGSATGVRPAFILAILTQESNLGANVGQCLLTDATTGAGKGKNTGTPFPNLMKADRDVAPFVALAKRLGFDPYVQVVSCSQSIGYGGAMGPAQFIPSTWVSYEARIAAATGKAVPNPWSAEDAIMAMAIYVSDLGAGLQTYSAEHTAAAKYYAGGGWATLGQGYANSVMGHTTRIQTNIDFLDDN